MCFLITDIRERVKVENMVRVMNKVMVKVMVMVMVSGIFRIMV